ncbi:MAG: DoxX family protein [bacterium]
MSEIHSILRSSGKYVNFGLLILRVGLGIMFVMHGLPKVQGGMEVWTQVGSAVQYVGIKSFYMIWGLLASVLEVGGGILLLAGLLFKPTVISLIVIMAVAANMHISLNEGFAGASHAIELGIVLLSLLITGPGKYSIDNSLFSDDDDDD